MNPNALPTIELTERVPRLCRLGPEAVDFLLGRHRTHVEVAPTRRRHAYRLTPRGHVGTIVTPGCRLLIRPKIPIQNFCHLLDPTTQIPVTEDHTAAARGVQLLDFLAGRLARLMDERAALGLHRAYVDRATEGPFVQGRVDVPAQMRTPHGRRDRLHCRFEEFTADVPWNQLPRSTADLVLHSPLLGVAARQALLHSLQAFASVQSVPLHPESFQQAESDRLTAPYVPLLDLCKLLAESLTPGRSAGEVPCPAFLLDMERVFENYCVRGLGTAFADPAAVCGELEIGVQPLFHPGGPAPGQPALSMRPDLTLHRRGRPCLVVDAKWKRSPRVQADLYQVLAYCGALGFPHGALVYPGKRDRNQDYRFPEMGLHVSIHTLQVIGSAEVCQRSLAALARRLSVRS